MIIILWFYYEFILKCKVKFLTNFASIWSIFQRIERDKELLLKERKVFRCNKERKAQMSFFPVWKSCLRILRWRKLPLLQVKDYFWHYFSIVKCQVEHYFALKRKKNLLWCCHFLTKVDDDNIIIFCSSHVFYFCPTVIYNWK